MAVNRFRKSVWRGKTWAFDPSVLRVTKVEKLVDSYQHYRRHVGLQRLHAAYRALYYEIKRKEPWA